MAESCSNFKNVSNVFNVIDGYFGEQKLSNGLIYDITNGLLHKYCHYGKNRGNDKCNDYLQKASSGVIHLLTNLKDTNGLDYDKLAEYAILWLCYKLNKKSPYHKTNLNDFYTKHIEKNNYYNNKIKDDDSLSYKEIIDKKKDLMNMSIKEILKLYEALKNLCNMYNKCNENNMDCNKCSEDANKFAGQFKELIKDSKIIEVSSYSQMLFTLSNDYDNLKNIYDIKCTNSPPLPMIKTPPSKLIPALSTFSVIPVFLGIAYKYSLFGIDKLFQRQYLRTKLKKVKKKMKINI
ncbi:CIR protein PIR protein [Plasmodium vinckei brucechwatti]|uniref:CIR protein PIR protein n=1 Tax=Plasmodium vinckei brucechwatti TaxID=119398 RepID=A0A6V7RXB1_PLAVN|nr:CIR protein PIR protein [Plasmodium vinckei brucechwatti]